MVSVSALRRSVSGKKDSVGKETLSGQNRSRWSPLHCCPSAKPPKKQRMRRRPCEQPQPGLSTHLYSTHSLGGPSVNLGGTHLSRRYKCWTLIGSR
ncbi:hypothetical protein MUK42_35555 [Musa troglodytarum]|uniref:Uncharacterized protein n=1 Tax=Musa troglodytarum TaxID=320322 RepID=A0A9E7FI42_9LILI|nr:hypothetical protein MUK42_35555 [Musa troglodytarum]